MNATKLTNLDDPKVSDFVDQCRDCSEDTLPDDHSPIDVTVDQSQPQIPLDQTSNMLLERLTLERSAPS